MRARGSIERQLGRLTIDIEPNHAMAAVDLLLACGRRHPHLPGLNGTVDLGSNLELGVLVEVSEPFELALLCGRQGCTLIVAEEVILFGSEFPQLRGLRRHTSKNAVAPPLIPLHTYISRRARAGSDYGVLSGSDHAD